MNSDWRGEGNPSNWSGDLYFEKILQGQSVMGLTDNYGSW